MVIIENTKPNPGMSPSSSVGASIISGGAGRNIVMTNRFLFKLVAFAGLFLAQQQHQLTALPLFISAVEATSPPSANKDTRNVSLRSAAAVQQKEQDGENNGDEKPVGFFRSLFSFWSLTEPKDDGFKHFYPSEIANGDGIGVPSTTSAFATTTTTTTEPEDISSTAVQRSSRNLACLNEDMAGTEGNCCCDGKIASFTAVYDSMFPANVTFYGRKGAILMSGATMLCIHRAVAGGCIPKGPTDEHCCDGVEDDGGWRPQTIIEPGMIATFFVNDASKKGLTSLGIFFDVGKFENETSYDEKIEIHTSCSEPILDIHKAGEDGVHALDIFRWTDTSVSFNHNHTYMYLYVLQESRMLYSHFWLTTIVLLPFLLI